MPVVLVLGAVSIVATRELIEGHTLYAVRIQEGRRPSAKKDSVQVYCSCGQRLTISSVGHEQAAIAGADRNHRLFGPDAVGFPLLDGDWHGTPNGHQAHGCGCDPCVWAWESYRRGDEPVDAAPTWLDSWLAGAAAP